MAKIKKINNGDGTWKYSFFCPGCNCDHYFDDRWDFNKDFNLPTIVNPITHVGYLGKKGDKLLYGTCKLSIVLGVIYYSSECTHDLSGQQVILEDILSGNERILDLFEVIASFVKSYDKTFDRISLEVNSDGNGTLYLNDGKVIYLEFNNEEELKRMIKENS